MRTIAITMPVVIALVCAPGLQARRSTVPIALFDETGAVPRNFRISCFKENSGFTNPMIKQYHRTQQQSTIYDHVNRSTVGVQDGRLVLTHDCAERGSIIVGDASDLNDIRMLPGVRLRVEEERVRGIEAWLTRSGRRNQRFSYAEGFQAQHFSGQTVMVAGMVPLLAASIVDGHRNNELVLAAALRNRWQGFVWEHETEGFQHLPSDSLERIKQTYAAPLQTAVASLEGSARERLLAHHRRIVAEGRAYLTQMTNLANSFEGAGCPDSQRELPAVLDYLEALEL